MVGAVEKTLRARTAAGKLPERAAVCLSMGLCFAKGSGDLICRKIKTRKYKCKTLYIHF